MPQDNQTARRAKNLRWPPRWCRRQPSLFTPAPDLLKCAGDGRFIRRGHFRQFASGQQQRTNARGRNWAPLSQHDESIGVADVQFVAGLDPRLFANGFRYDHLSLVRYIGNHAVSLALLWKESTGFSQNASQDTLRNQVIVLKLSSPRSSLNRDCWAKQCHAGYKPVRPRDAAWFWRLPRGEVPHGRRRRPARPAARAGRKDNESKFAGSCA